MPHRRARPRRRGPPREVYLGELEAAPDEVRTIAEFSVIRVGAGYRGLRFGPDGTRAGVGRPEVDGRDVHHEEVVQARAGTIKVLYKMTWKAEKRD